MLTPADETNLLTALFGGLLERPYWTSFLDRLLKRTRADHVGMIIAPPRRPITDAPRWFAGRDLADAGGRLSDPAMIDPAAYQRLRPGRVYATAEIFDPRMTARVGPVVAHGRYMRVVEASGVNCWLTVLRERSDFSAADSFVLSSLGPHIAVALQLLAALEAEQWRRAIAQDVLERAGVSWSFDDAEVRGGTVKGEQSAASLLAPVPAHDYITAGREGAVVLARSARPATEAQVDGAMTLFGLTRSEARLALHLAQGRSLHEAGEMLNITRETARNYSKRVFEKTGSRGQADLVRRILTSVVTLV